MSIYQAVSTTVAICFFGFSWYFSVEGPGGSHDPALTVERFDGFISNEGCGKKCVSWKPMFKINK